MTDEQIKKMMVMIVTSRAWSLAHDASLELLTPEERQKVKARAKALFPQYRLEALFQIEDMHPALSAEILAEMRGHSPIDPENSKPD